MKRYVVIPIAAALIAAGCGSSSSSNTLSKQQFLMAGNAVCSSGTAALNAIPGPAGNPTPQEVRQLVDNSFAPLIQAQISALGKIGANSADSKQVASIVAEAQAALNSVKSNPQLLQASPTSPSSPFYHVSQRLHAYGLTQCASG